MDDVLAQAIPEEFAGVFSRFAQLEEKSVRKVYDEPQQPPPDDTNNAAVNDGAAADVDRPVKKDNLKKISKRQLKQLLRPDIAALKLRASRPEVVESWDTTAPDPNFLVYLKAYRNTVPVPVHWSMKSRYLSGKRAIEKIPYKLPPYMEATKIGEIRAAILEKEAQKSLKRKQREKLRPKSHRLHIDFQVLHDAFFKYSEKPPMSGFGDLYYEGREREEIARSFKPGQLSPALREALGILLPVQPTPWLFMMQRYGPPPAYPNLKIPGVNAPIPTGAQWGVNGWGKAPTDHFGNPIYPGVVGPPAALPNAADEFVMSTAKPVFWGEVLVAEDAESDAEEDEQHLTQLNTATLVDGNSGGAAAATIVP